MPSPARCTCKNVREYHDECESQLRDLCCERENLLRAVRPNRNVSCCSEKVHGFDTRKTDPGGHFP